MSTPESTLTNQTSNTRRRGRRRKSREPDQGDITYEPFDRIVRTDPADDYIEKTDSGIQANQRSYPNPKFRPSPSLKPLGSMSTTPATDMLATTPPPRETMPDLLSPGLLIHNAHASRPRQQESKEDDAPTQTSGATPSDILAKMRGLGLAPSDDSADKDDSANVARTVDDELGKLGWTPTARKSFLGDMGRENNWSRDTIFGGHSDPKNQAANRGIISWQGDRRKNLDKYLTDRGMAGRNDDDALREMVRFADTEMQSNPEWQSVHAGMRDPNLRTSDTSKLLQSYIKYDPGAPYNSPDPDYVTKNNRQWAEKATKLGLAQGDSPDEIKAKIDRVLGTGDTAMATPPADAQEKIDGLFGDKPTPAPQSADNLPPSTDNTEPKGRYPALEKPGFAAPQAPKPPEDMKAYHRFIKQNALVDSFNKLEPEQGFAVYQQYQAGNPEVVKEVDSHRKAVVAAKREYRQQVAARDEQIKKAALAQRIQMTMGTAENFLRGNDPITSALLTLGVDIRKPQERRIKSPNFQSLTPSKDIMRSIEPTRTQRKIDDVISRESSRTGPGLKPFEERLAASLKQQGIDPQMVTNQQGMTYIGNPEVVSRIPGGSPEGHSVLEGLSFDEIAEMRANKERIARGSVIAPVAAQIISKTFGLNPASGTAAIDTLSRQFGQQAPRILGTTAGQIANAIEGLVGNDVLAPDSLGRDFVTYLQSRERVLSEAANYRPEKEGAGGKLSRALIEQGFNIGKLMAISNAVGVSMPVVMAGEAVAQNATRDPQSIAIEAAKAYALGKVFEFIPGGRLGSVAAGSAIFAATEKYGNPDATAEDILIAAAAGGLFALPFKGQRGRDIARRTLEPVARGEGSVGENVPENVRSAAARGAGLEPIFAETPSGRKATVLVDPETGRASQFRPLSEQEYGQASKGAERRVRQVSDEQFDQFADESQFGSRETPEADAETSPMDIQPMNRQIDAGGETRMRPVAPKEPEGGAPDGERTVTHPNPAIDGKPVIRETEDGKVVVANPENKTGVSRVKDRGESVSREPSRDDLINQFINAPDFGSADAAFSAARNAGIEPEELQAALTAANSNRTDNVISGTNPAVDETIQSDPGTNAPRSETIVPVPETSAPPAPESLETTKSQFRAAVNPDSERFGVLITKGTEPPKSTPHNFVWFPVGDGERFYLHLPKAKALGISGPEAVKAFVADRANIEKAIGIVSPVANTGQGVAVRTEDADGRELETRVVDSPEALEHQAAADAISHPEAANQEVMSAEEAVARRVGENGAPRIARGLTVTPRAEATSPRDSKGLGTEWLDLTDEERADIHKGFDAEERAAELEQAKPSQVQGQKEASLNTRQPAAQSQAAAPIKSSETAVAIASRERLPAVSGEKPAVSPDYIRERVSPSEMGGAYTSDGLRRTLELPNDYPISLLEKADLVQRSPEGQYEFTEQVYQQPKVINTTKSALESQPEIEAKPVERRKTSPETKAKDVQKSDTKTWKPFPSEMGSLKIPRASMPQVHSQHRGALVQFLKGRGITHESEEVLPGTLKPSQTEFSPEKVQAAREFTGGNRSILISSDNHVVDGHHQWLQARLDAPDTPIPVIRLNAPIHPLLIEVARFPSSGVDDGAGPVTVAKATANEERGDATIPERKLTASEQKTQSKLNRVAKRRAYTRPSANPAKHSLHQYVALKGGINASDAFDTSPIEHGRYGIHPLVRKNGGGMDAEDMMRSAIEDGYLPEHHYTVSKEGAYDRNTDFLPNDFIQAIADDEGGGVPSHSVHNEAFEKAAELGATTEEEVRFLEQEAKLFRDPDAEAIFKDIENTGKITETQREELAIIGESYELSEDTIEAAIGHIRSNAAARIEVESDPDSTPDDAQNYARLFSKEPAEEIDESEPEGEVDTSFDFAEKPAREAPEMAGALQMAMPNRAQSPEPVFYSQLQRAIESKMPNRASVDQVRSLIRNPQSGVKADEVKWTGLDDFLREKTGAITKKDVLDFLAANNVKVEEVTKGNPYDVLTRGEQDEINKLLKSADNLGFDYDSQARSAIVNHPDWATRWDVSDNPRLIELGNKLREVVLSGRKSATKFEKYTLPGAKEGSYRELLLTLPLKPGKVFTPPDPVTKLPEGYEHIHDSHNPPERQWGMLPPGQHHARFWAGEHPTREAATVAALEKFNQEREWEAEEAWKKLHPDDEGVRGHFDEPNVLAHVRFNERTDADGRKVLFIEEIQSDWHQKGRTQGYVDRAKEQKIYDIARKIYHSQTAPQAKIESLWKQADAAGVTEQEIEQAFKDYAPDFTKTPAGKDGVPDAPFSKNWHELAMKRMLRYAAENGYDRVAWTTGEQQAERYDLSKHLKRITYEPVNWEDASRGSASATPVEYTALHVESMDGEMLQAGIAERVDGAFYDEQRHAAIVPNTALPDVVGKELADKIINGEGESKAWLGDSYENTREFAGLDLKVGGEGMKGFYDQMLPAFMNKYGKKWGARVGETKIEQGASKDSSTVFETVEPGISYSGKWDVVRRDQGKATASFDTKAEADAETRKRNGDTSAAVHSIDITPSMKASVMQGQSLFMAQENSKRLREIKNGADLVPVMQFERVGDLVTGDYNTAEILRRADEQVKLSAGEKDAPESDDIAGLFLEAHHLDLTHAKSYVRALKEFAENLRSNGYKDESRRVTAFADELTEAAKEGKGTAVFSVNDEQVSQAAIAHESFHQGSHLGSGGKALSDRLREEDIEAIQSTPYYQKGAPALRKNISALTDASDHVIMEELAARSAQISDKILEAAGITQDERDDFLEKWTHSFVLKNGENAFDEFRRQEPHVRKAIENSKRLGRPAKAEPTGDGSVATGASGEAGAGDEGPPSQGTPPQNESANEDPKSVKTRVRSLPGTMRAHGLIAADEIYEVYGNKQALLDGKAKLQKLDWEGAEAHLRSDKALGADDHAMAKIMLRAIRNLVGDNANADPEFATELVKYSQDLSKVISRKLTEAGQLVQATQINDTSVEDVMIAASKIAKARGRDITIKENARIVEAGEDLERRTAELEAAGAIVGEERDITKAAADWAARAAEGALTQKEIASLRKTLTKLRTKEKRREDRIAAMDKMIAPRPRKPANIRQRAIDRLMREQDSLMAEIRADLGHAPLAMALPREEVEARASRSGKISEETLTKIARVGALKLLMADAGTLSVAELKKDLVADFGDQVAPHIDQIHAEAVKTRNRILREEREANAIDTILNRAGNDGMDEAGARKVMEEAEIETRRKMRVTAEHNRAAKRYQRDVDSTISDTKVSSPTLAAAISRHADSDVAAASAAKQSLRDTTPDRILKELMGEFDLDRKQAERAYVAGGRALQVARHEIKLSKELTDSLKEYAAYTSKQLDQSLAVLQQARRDHGAATRLVASRLEELDKGRVTVAIGKIWNQTKGVPIALMAGGDMSQLLRQGGITIFVHPSLAPGFIKAAFSSVTKGGFAKVIDAVTQHPKFALSQMSGVDYAFAGKADGGDEFFEGAEILRSIPILKQYVEMSDRDFGGSLDELRMAYFDLLSDDLAASGVAYRDHPEAYKFIGRFINMATGRGDIGPHNSRVTEAYLALGKLYGFAPRYRVSRIQYLTLPFNRGFWRAPKSVRRIVYKDWTRWFATQAAIQALLKALGYITAGAVAGYLNPDDDDFLKIKIGKLRFDVTGGVQVPARYISRLLKETYRASTGEVTAKMATEETWKQTLRFLHSGADPRFSLAYEALMGQTYDRKPFTWFGDYWLDGALGSRLAPLNLSQGVGIAKREGLKYGAASWPLEFFGASVNVYADNPDEPKSEAQYLAKRFRTFYDSKRPPLDEKTKNLLNDLKTRARGGEDVSADIEPLIESPEDDDKAKMNKITQGRADSIINAKDQTAFQEDIRALPLEDAQHVLRYASPEEKASVADVVRMKALREEEKKDKAAKAAARPREAEENRIKGEKAKESRERNLERRYGQAVP